MALVKAILSNDAYKLLTELSNSVLIDVRTENEWKNSGTPNLKNLMLVTYDQLNEENFVKIVDEHVEDKSAIIFLLCRSGVRSLNAGIILVNNGYKHSYNIQDGYEGNHLGSGWIDNRLPITSYNHRDR